MRLFRSGLCAMVLCSAPPAWASDDCDLFCRMQSYLSSDHMVTLVPASTEPAPVKAKPTTRKKNRTAARRAPSTAKIAKATQTYRPEASLAKARLGVVSRAEPPVPTRLPASAPSPNPARAPAGPVPSLIPGSAPTITPQFGPPAEFSVR